MNWLILDNLRLTSQEINPDKLCDFSATNKTAKGNHRNTWTF